jgi:hypothetical protein
MLNKPFVAKESCLSEAIVIVLLADISIFPVCGLTVKYVPEIFPGEIRTQRVPIYLYVEY